jgi:uncharacterized membrane protein YkoI
MSGWLALSVVIYMLSGMAMGAEDAKEGKVPLDKVPKAVLKAVRDKFKGAELVNAQTEKEDGKLIYEIIINDKGQNVDVSVTPEGKIISFERTIATKELPRPVIEAINKKYPQAEFKRIEEFTEEEKMNYEVLLVTDDKKMIELVLDREGKILREEKQEKKKEED